MEARGCLFSACCFEMPLQNASQFMFTPTSLGALLLSVQYKSLMGIWPDSLLPSESLACETIYIGVRILLSFSLLCFLLCVPESHRPKLACCLVAWLKNEILFYSILPASMLLASFHHGNLRAENLGSCDVDIDQSAGSMVMYFPW